MIISKKLTSTLFRLSISIVLLFLLFVFNRIDPIRLLENIKKADKFILGLAFLAFLLNYVLCFFRWEILLKAVDINLPFKRLIWAFCGGIFFSLFLPSSIGGDLSRSIDLAKHTKRTREVVATVLLDRISGYIGLAILVLFSLFFGWNLVKNDRDIIFSIAIIMAILIVILLVLFNNFCFSKLNKFLDSPKAGRIRQVIKDLHEEIHIFKHRKKIIFKNLILSLLIQATGPVTFYLTALSLGINNNIIYFFVIVPIIGAVTLLPISIGGFGLREQATVKFFSTVGINNTLSAAMAILNSFFILLYGLIGGIIYYVLTVYHRRIQRHQSPPV